MVRVDVFTSPGQAMWRKCRLRLNFSAKQPLFQELVPALPHGLGANATENAFP